MKLLGKSINAPQALSLMSIASAMLMDKYGQRRVAVNLSQLGVVIKVDNTIALTAVVNLDRSGTWSVNYDTRYVNFNNVSEILNAPTTSSSGDPERQRTIYADGSVEPRTWWEHLGFDWGKALAV